MDEKKKFVPDLLKILPNFSKDFNDGLTADTNSVKEVIEDTIKFSDDRCKAIEGLIEIELTKDNPNYDYIRELGEQLSEERARNHEKSDKMTDHAKDVSNKRDIFEKGLTAAALVATGAIAANGKRLGKWAAKTVPMLATKFIK